ncbi:MAG TPA: NADH-quinone oxidoreductase subunit L, partial [Jatrophihabitans sp.]
VGGYLLVYGGGVQHWLEPSVGPSLEVGVHTISPVVLSLITLVVVVLGVAGALVAFRQVPEYQPAGNAVTVAARRNVYADAFNEAVLMRPGQWLSRALVYLDNRGVDGAVNGIGASLGGSSSRLKRIQTGFVRSYALSMLAGTVAVVAVLLAVRFQ